MPGGTLPKIFTAALASSDLSMVYQPIRSIADKIDTPVSYFEALLRVKGISPIVFLSRLDAADYFKLDLWVVQQVTAQPSHYCYAINISPFSFSNRELISLLLQSRDRLVLEIVEHYAFTLEQNVLLGEICCQFSVMLDDLGVAYSSLDRLCSFAFRGIKIDGSLILRIEKSHKARTIVAALMQMAQKLNISCVAECVETEAIWQLLREAHAAIAPNLSLYVQGWAVGLPQSLPTFYS